MSFASQSHVPFGGHWGEDFGSYGDEFGSQTRRTIRQGTTGSDVRAWQEALNRWGQSKGHPAISVDSSFGPATASLTRAFQAAEGLAQDGVVGPATRASMTRARVGPVISQGVSHTSRVPLAQANSALQALAPTGAKFVQPDYNMPPSQGSVVVEGRYYVFLDDNGRRLSARSAPSTPSTPGMARPPATPALFQPTGSYAVPVVPPGLPAVPQKLTKHPSTSPRALELRPCS